MSTYSEKISKLVEQEREFRAVIGGVTYRVVAERLDDDHLVLKDQDGNHRFDLHYTQLIILSPSQ